jgi:AraC family transcriptional regulator, transcriptional activator of pobA
MKELFPFYSIGHFINQPTSPTEFEIMRFDEMEEPDVDDLHKHTFYEIIWIEKGKSRQVIDYVDHEINPGSLFFISPGQLHIFEEWKPITGGSLLFTEDFLLLYHQDKDKLFELSFLDNFYSNPVLRPDKKSFVEILQTISQLSVEKKRKDYSPAMAQALLQVLLLQIQRSIDAQATNIISKKYIVIYKKFKNLIDVNFTKNLSVSEYASKLAITQHHLNHITKEVTGKTATEVIRARGVLEAKRLLSFTDHSISEIAAELGYFDSSYFAKIFKAETGSSPLEFKSTISESYRRR